jgi:tetratricopeptide (TPR) repeat protein
VTPVVWLVLAQAASSTAWSSARPPECAPLDGAAANNVWERVKAPELRKYCDLLASGASKLAGNQALAGSVLGLADEAEQTMPGRAAPMVLKGRALAQLGRDAEAATALAEAKKRDDRALDDPLALLAWARSLTRSGRLKEASDAYRALLPRASTLTLADRAAASLEAGMLAMGRGPEGLEQGLPIFREALRDAQDLAQTVAVAALALALDRAGQHDEAATLLSERLHGDPRALLSAPRGRELLGPVGGAEIDALTALALESRDPAAAREAWLRYADGNPKGPWAEQARARAASVARRGPARRGPR